MTLPARALRTARPLAALGLSLGMLCCAGPAASAASAASAMPATFTASAASAASPASAASRSRGIGWLRLAHLSPNTPPVDVYLYSFGDSHAMIVLKHVSYGTVSPYQSVKSGDYTVAMRSAGASANSKPVLSTSVNVTARDAYTVAGMGPLAGLRLQVMRDRLSTPPGEAQVLAGNEAFARVSSYQVVSPGTWTVHAGGASESVSSKVTLIAGSIHTLVVLDHPGRLWIASLEDAAGSKVFPEGGAATGFGGTAPRPGSSPVPWLAALAAGMILTLTGAKRMRRAGQRRSRHGRPVTPER